MNVSSLQAADTYSAPRYTQIPCLLGIYPCFLLMKVNEKMREITPGADCTEGFKELWFYGFKKTAFHEQLLRAKIMIISHCALEREKKENETVQQKGRDK